VNRAETDIEVHSLGGNYRGRAGATVGEAAGSYNESFYEAEKIKKEVIN
jgi:DeoR/GlpR family transcriptional regulator of sugar metabolism